MSTSHRLSLTGREKFRAAKENITRQARTRLRSRLKESAHADEALAAADEDDFVTIVKHRLLRRKSIKIAVAPDIVKTLFEIQKGRLDHVESVQQRKKRELREESDRRRAALEEVGKVRAYTKEVERLQREEAERFRFTREQQERREREAEEREKLIREAEERREELERRRAEVEAETRRNRRENYQKKFAAVVGASNQKEKEKALREVGKLTILDFNTQEEWESHQKAQKDVGKLNINKIAGKFKKKQPQKKRRKTQTINWSNAKALINKFADVKVQDEVVLFVKPTAVDLTDIGCYDGNDYPSPAAPTDRAEDLGTPDSGIRSLSGHELEQLEVEQQQVEQQVEVEQQQLEQQQVEQLEVKQQQQVEQQQVEQQQVEQQQQVELYVEG